MSTTMSISISLPNCRSLCVLCVTRILKRWRTAKSPGFRQDVSNTHGFVCTCLYIRISFRKRALIRKASKTSNDIRFCEEPKTIVVVDKWFNSLNLTHILLFNLQIDPGKGS